MIKYKRVRLVGMILVAVLLFYGLSGSCAFADGLPTDVASWATLLNFRAAEPVQASLLGRDSTMRIQPIEEAAGVNLNYDYYPVYIPKYPTIGGVVLDQSSMLEYVRVHLADFLNKKEVLLFQGYAVSDTATWSSANPLGALMRFRIVLVAPAFDDGTVLTSDYVAGDHWTFSPIETRLDGTHPVSGNRMFGMTVASDGTPVFYTKGADRVCTGALAESVAFAAADDLWTSFQQAVAKFVRDNGGSASVELPPNDRVSLRTPWSSVAGIFNPAPPWDASTPAVGPGTFHCG